MDTIHQLLIGIGDPVPVEDRFASPAQQTSLDRLKSHPVDQQSSGFPDDFVLEKEFSWLEGIVGKVIFQLEEWMEPGAVAGKDGRAFMQDSEGRYLRCRHRFVPHIMARPPLSLMV
jgi:hypothetical protein